MKASITNPVAAIKAAIAEQLPTGFDSTGCWFPLTVDGEEFYIRGNEIVTLELFQDATAFALAGLAR
jgi:hypothetical protein